MPILNFYCPECKTVTKELVYGQVNIVPCKTCGKPMVRKMQGAALIVKETIDNGVQSRKVEQIADSSRLLEERLIEHDKYLKKEK